MNRWLTNLALTIVLLALTAGLLIAVNRAVGPQPRVLPPKGASAPDYAAIAAKVTADSIRHDAIALAHGGTRHTGSRAAEDAADYLSATLTKLGYQVIEQPFAVTLPITRHARITDEHSNPIAGVSVHPLLPNHFRTATTSPGGVRGKVYRGEFGLAREFTGVDLKGNIALLPIGVPWNTVAGMGARAVLYFDDGRKLDSAAFATMPASLDVPRFLIQGDPAALAGKTVVVDARVDFEEVTARNIIGILPARSASARREEALVLSAHYDAAAYAPDLSFGGDQAGGTLTALASARLLAGQADAHQRSVIVLFTAAHSQVLAGMREFVATVGSRDGRQRAHRDAGKAVDQASARVAQVKSVRQVIDDPAYWTVTDDRGEGNYWSARHAPSRQATEDLLRTVLDRDQLGALESTLTARVDWVRGGMPVSAASGQPHPIFEAYTAARLREQVVGGLLATPVGAMKGRLQQQPGQIDGDLAQRAREVSDEALVDAQRAEAMAKARLAVCEAIKPYERLLFLSLDLTPRSGRLGLAVGDSTAATQCMPADAEIAAQMLRAAEALDKADTSTPYSRNSMGQARFLNLLRSENEADSLPFLKAGNGAPAYMESVPATFAGHTAFTLVTLDDSRERMGTPHDTFDDLLADPPAATQPAAAQSITPIQNLAMATRIVAAGACQIARGQGQVLPTQVNPDLTTVRGLVVSQIGDNLTPNHVMPGAIVIAGPPATWRGPVRALPGVETVIRVTADRDGRFEMPELFAHAVSLDYTPTLDLDTAVVRPVDGQVTWALSSTHSGPRMPYAVMRVPLAQYQRSEANAVVFRAAPMQLFPMANPTTLRGYSGFELLESRSMAAPKQTKIESAGSAHVCFVPPESRLYVAFKDGNPRNPGLLETRAFALGMATGDAPVTAMAAGREIDGPGYLAADTPTIINIEIDAAVSMAAVNGRRAEAQDRHHMADDMVMSYSRRASELAQEAKSLTDKGDIVAAKRFAGDAIAYSSNIHPVIRQNATDAVWGILFYLVLAIPFAFFLEKLLVNASDIRWQIVGQGVIFLLFFLALRLTHPAYTLVRSSLMILLGFVTFMLAVMVSAFVAGMFSRNIEILTRRQQRRAEAADVTRAGAAATAFALGLNNLRRRPVRTGLTAGTLVLMTFVMICFTSVSSDLVDIEFALGRASYSGLLVRDRNLGDTSSALAPMRERFGEFHLVAPRAWGGNFTADGQNAELARFDLIHKDGARAHEARAAAIVGLSAVEAQVTPVTQAFTVLNRWFESDKEYACMLPRRIADELRLDEAMVKAGTSMLTIAGREYKVLGIFDESKLDAILDLDGQSMMPLDVRQLRRLGQGGGKTDDPTATPEDVPRLSSREVMITPIEAMPSRTQLASIAVCFRNYDYAQSRQMVTSHLERTGQAAYYGLDGVAYYGGKFRMQSLQGLIDLLLPIILSALTVLNTMRGSVYERRNELYVFNAVGLAPRHILALFLAEACVYAVLGAVGGYLLAQGLGAGLKLFSVTGGLAINYSSLSGVMVSIVIMVVVILASLLPARTAARLAAPAETMTRQRHTTEGDAMELDLPFTFNRRDRVAIVPYFTDWFEDFGEGSSGEFFCAPPTAQVRWIETPNGQKPIPTVTTTAWLKPYDLGVSQSVELIVRPDPRSGDNVATVIMTRKSGDHASWERCCHAFVGMLRKRFLTWRAIGEKDRELLLGRGRELLTPKDDAANPPKEVASRE